VKVITARPILMSAPMVQALLEERKTQTRRIIKPQPTGEPRPLHEWSASLARACHDHSPDADKLRVHVERLKGRIFPFSDPRGGLYSPTCPFGRPGDILWVRENWRVGKQWDTTRPRDLPPRHLTVMFAAGGSVANQGSGRYELDESYPDTLPDWAGKLRPGMFLPRWASRLTLRITEVRIERLQDISNEDAEAEGVRCDHSSWSFRDHYCELWDRINGQCSWSLNEWVWALTFRVEKRNVDDVLREAA